jgi:hypothetical protein
MPSSIIFPQSETNPKSPLKEEHTLTKTYGLEKDDVINGWENYIMKNFSVGTTRGILLRCLRGERDESIEKMRNTYKILVGNPPKRRDHFQRQTCRQQNHI